MIEYNIGDILVTCRPNLWNNPHFYKIVGLTKKNNLRVINLKTTSHVIYSDLLQCRINTIPILEDKSYESAPIIVLRKNKYSRYKVPGEKEYVVGICYTGRSYSSWYGQ